MKGDWRYRCYVSQMIDQIHNFTPDYEDVVEEESFQDFNIHEAIANCTTLTEKQRYIIERRYCYSDTFQTIADHFKCSKVYIFNQHKTALKKLKTYLGGDNAI